MDCYFRSNKWSRYIFSNSNYTEGNVHLTCRNLKKNKVKPVTWLCDWRIFELQFAARQIASLCFLYSSNSWQFIWNVCQSWVMVFGGDNFSILVSCFNPWSARSRLLWSHVGQRVHSSSLEYMTDWLTGWLADWLTGWLNDWMTDILADRLSELLSDWLTDWLACWQTYCLTCRLTGWLACWLTDWLTCWPADWQTDWLTGWLADRLTDY